MRGNEQKYVPDPRSRSPGTSQYSNLAGDYQATAATFTPGDRMTYTAPDYGRMNSGGSIPYQTSSSINQNYYEKDFKVPPAYAPPLTQQFSLPEYRPTFDANTMFVPQSRYLQEEMKKSAYSKDFNFTPTGTKPMTMSSGYSAMPIPQPQKYEPKPETQKYEFILEQLNDLKIYVLNFKISAELCNA